jgi:hypothetical protein
VDWQELIDSELKGQTRKGLRTQAIKACEELDKWQAAGIVRFWTVEQTDKGTLKWRMVLKDYSSLGPWSQGYVVMYIKGFKDALRLIREG